MRVERCGLRQEGLVVSLCGINMRRKIEWVGIGDTHRRPEGLGEHLV